MTSCSASPGTCDPDVSPLRCQAHAAPSCANRAVIKRLTVSIPPGEARIESQRSRSSGPISPVPGGRAGIQAAGLYLPALHVALEYRIRQVTCRLSVRQAACVYSLIRPPRKGRMLNWQSPQDAWTIRPWPCRCLTDSQEAGQHLSGMPLAGRPAVHRPASTAAGQVLVSPSPGPAPAAADFASSSSSCARRAASSM